MMCWTTLDGCHINLDKLTVFFWSDGGLVLYHVNKNVKLSDPDKRLYFKLCNDLGMNPVREG